MLFLPAVHQDEADALMLIEPEIPLLAQASQTECQAKEKPVPKIANEIIVRHRHHRHHRLFYKKL